MAAALYREFSRTGMALQVSSGTNPAGLAGIGLPHLTALANSFRLRNASLCEATHDLARRIENAQGAVREAPYSSQTIKNHQPPANGLLERGAENGMRVLNGSRRQTFFVHDANHALQIGRREPQEFPLAQRGPKVAAEQRSVIADGFGSQFGLSSELEPAVEVLVERQAHTVEFSCPLMLLEPRIEVMLCSAKVAVDGVVQTFAPAGVLIAPQRDTHQPATGAASDDLTELSRQGGFSFERMSHTTCTVRVSHPGVPCGVCEWSD